MMEVQSVLDFLTILPLSEDVKYFKVKDAHEIKVVTTEQEFECYVHDMKSFIKSVKETMYPIYDVNDWLI